MPVNREPRQAGRKHDPAYRWCGIYLPVRPSHLCRPCGESWPCATAQVDLVAEFYGDPTGLSVYLGTRYVEALRDILSVNPDFDTTGMYERYLDWTDLAERPRTR